MIKTLLIAPYSGLAESAKKIPLPEDFNLNIKIANLEEAIEIAKEAEKNEYDLIISRGGTASMIQKVVSIPVIHIDISGYDMLRVFTLIRDINQGVALVGFENISRGAGTLCNILEYDVKMITISSRSEVRPRLEELKKNGYDVVIGDVVTIQEAERVGLHGILITSGKEAILDAFDEGRRQFNLFKKIRTQVTYFNNIFQSIPFPTLLLNENMEVIDKNIQANKNICYEEIVNSPVTKKLVQNVLADGKPHWNEVEGKSYVYEIQTFLANHKKPVIGLMVHSYYLKTKQRNIEIKTNPIHLPIIGESEQAIDLRKNIGRYSDVEQPVVIIGELGTGKKTIAQSIHFGSFGQNSPLIYVEGNSVTTPELLQLKSKLSKIQNGTLIIKNIDEAPINIQNSISNLLMDIPTTIKLIALSRSSLDFLIQNGNFDRCLYEKISKVTLHLPPLRERKEDINAFVSYYLSELHKENGNDTLGIRTEAVEFLKKFDWIGNFKELKNVVQELSMITSDYYIELSHVKQIMTSKYNSFNTTENNTIQIDGTLSEMEQQIIRKVLEAENQNQTKAAKRLGINRTTLWRKLNHKAEKMDI